MKSIRSKVTLLTVCIVIATVTVVTTLGAIAIKSIGEKDAEQMLLMMCQTGQKNLDHYFVSVEQSVEMVSSFVRQDLDGLESDKLQAHVDRTRSIFADTANHTNGVLTYYYRIDPAVSKTVKGFWYTNLDGDGFEEHEVTDITLYDTEDTSNLVWFTVPKMKGESVWLAPYITDNIDVRVMSYNMPVYYGDTFVGVIGIEIDANAMEEMVDNIQVYDSGYAFINDNNGYLIYHSRLSEEVVEKERNRPAPYGMIEENTLVHYMYEGVEKEAVWLPLSNGMRLNVAVPLSEINAGWHKWINETVLVSGILLLIFILLTMHFTKRITKPLDDLSRAAEQVDQGNYDVKLEYKGDDEIGKLSGTFNLLITHLKTYIRGLTDLAYGDALTAVRNKGAFDIVMGEIQKRIDNPEEEAPAFAVCYFDCNNLKEINDRYGHDKGDLYLQRTCKTICQVFAHSPVFRIGGDEFATILQNTEYDRKDELIETFDNRCFDLRAMANEPWEKIDVARGIAVFDPDKNETVDDVVRRADRMMYKNKRETKGGE